MARKKAKSEAPKKIKPISLNILEIAKRLQTLEQTSGGGGDTSALVSKTDIAPEFSDATNYYNGDLVYYNGILYEFQLDHTAGAWEQSEVQQKDLSDIINNIPAERITYDNTNSDLQATNVQGAVDELAESYPADKVLMSDGVTSVEDVLDGVTANTASTGIDISGYNTSSNKYEFPSDGYIYINNDTGQTGAAYVYGSNNNVCSLVGGVEGKQSLFVRKGLKVYIYGTVAGAYYYPLS